ncbi:MAG TPA: hypothetical protein PK280_17180, partial [Planctomycetota bacterium]|nr:hypothetical protein [Planctomycetota bacterium]
MLHRVIAALFAVLLAAPAAALAVEAAPAEPPKEQPKAPPPPPPPPADADAALTAKIGALYKGKVVRFDPRTLYLELLYEFKDEKEAGDFALSDWAFGGRKGSLKVADGGLRLLKTHQVALVPGRFSSVTAAVDFAMLTSGGEAAACLTVCSDGAGNFFEIVGLYHGNASLQKCSAGGFSWLGRTVPSPFARDRRGSMGIGFANGQIRAPVGNQALEAKDAQFTAGQVGLRAYEGDVEFRNLRIAGTL